jgi:uncharacterized protein (TIRG00374 family)
MLINKLLRVFLGIFVAIFFVWLTFRQLNLKDIYEALIAINYNYICLAFIFFITGYLIRIYRWYMLLKISGSSATYKSCGGPLVASFALNNVLPFRAGDILRAFAFNKNLGVSSAVVLATLLVERLLDLFSLLVILLLAFRFFNVDSISVLGVGVGLILFLVVFILTCLLFPKCFKFIGLWLCKIVNLVSHKIASKLEYDFNKVLQTLEVLSRGKRVLQLVFLSIFVWVSEGVVFIFSAYAMPSLNNPLYGLLALPMGTMATLIPSTPGYVGTFDFFTALAMTIGGNSMASSAAFALLVHLLIWLPPTLVGLSYLLLTQTRFVKNPRA